MDWGKIQKINRTEIESKLSQIEEILISQKEAFESGQGLMGGKLGIALFFLYYAKMTNRQKPYDFGVELISKVFDDINNGFNYHTHAGGLAGIGAILTLLTEADLLDADLNEILNGLDEYLYTLMISEIRNGNYDFLHGAVGLGFYFLKRNTKDSKNYLAEFIHELNTIATKDEEGIRWLSFLKNTKQIKGFNISLSHGLASIIVFLSKVYSAGIVRDKTGELLSGAVKYLLNQQQDTSENISNFPSYVCETEPSSYSRLAWCYGDLGIGTALYVAGLNANNEDWKEKGIEVVLHSTKRREEKVTGVVDACLCHGTAGIAHMYNRMYYYTGIYEFSEAATYWFEQTLQMAKFEDGLAGYKVWKTPERGGFQNEYGFLEGIAGIGLAFISAISNIEPEWDECLFLS
ncbi:lanthionine synthetase C family protein [Marinifilum fragile]|uniref:lanthionine synthetase C family protein n=1 Tax=Marinifilum fragile TaxID=570161 RepID=UPI002AA68052|nr:lanthionine synthetase C family protein [Marinifilum fragile]